VPYFDITDSKNREITNKTFIGKYLLIDFWQVGVRGVGKKIHTW